MGVPGLWKLLESVGENKSLCSLAVEHRVKAQREGLADGTLTLGVDMGTVSAECTAGALAGGVFRQHAGGGLYVFFRRLEELIKAPVSLIFVFDGAGRPAIKRGHAVINKPPWWLHLARELILYFGFQSHDAPGEAEAELARLNREGHIHGVITGDGDTLVFGASLVLRTLPKGEQDFPDEYQVFTSAALNNPSNGLHLSRGGLLLLPLLAGGDYNHGLPGCGLKSALALAKCGYGDELLDAINNLGGEAYGKFLIEWRNSLRRELSTNAQGMLGNRQPHIAANVEPTFPRHEDIQLYLDPLTSWSDGNHPALTFRKVQEPSIRMITRFCMKHFRWNAETVVKKFGTDLWEGIGLQMVYSPLALYDARTLKFLTPDTQAVVLKASLQARRGGFSVLFRDELQPRLVLSTDDFVTSAMGSAFTQALGGKVTVWPRRELLPSTLLFSNSKKKKEVNVSAMIRNPKGEGSSKRPATEFIDIPDSDDEHDASVVFRRTEDTKVIDLTGEPSDAGVDARVNWKEDEDGVIVIEDD